MRLPAPVMSAIVVHEDRAGLNREPPGEAEQLLGDPDEPENHKHVVHPENRHGTAEEPDEIHYREVRDRG